MEKKIIVLGFHNGINIHTIMFNNLIFLVFLEFTNIFMMKICQKETLIYRTKHNLSLQNDVLKFHI